MKYDVLIIGSGPSGLTAGIYLSKAGLNTAIIHNDSPGGKMVYISEITNYPGFKKMIGADLSMEMYNHALDAGVKFIFGEVNLINEKDEIFLKNSKDTFIASKIIVAIGTTKRIPEVKGIDKSGVSYCAICDGPIYKDKTVAVIGSGRAAFEESHYLSTICKKVYLFTKEKLKVSSKLIEDIKKVKNIEVRQEMVEEVIGDSFVKKIKTNKSEYDVSAVFPYIGVNAASDFVNVDKTKDGYIKTNEKMLSSNSNIYAIGDIRDKDIRQIVTASNDGVIAAVDIIEKWQRGK